VIVDLDASADVNVSVVVAVSIVVAVTASVVVNVSLSVTVVVIVIAVAVAIIIVIDKYSLYYLDDTAYVLALYTGKRRCLRHCRRLDRAPVRHTLDLGHPLL
jgi:hypothetical protein